MRVCDFCGDKESTPPASPTLKRAVLKLVDLDVPTGTPESNMFISQGPFDVCPKCLGKLKDAVKAVPAGIVVQPVKEKK